MNAKTKTDARLALAASVRTASGKDGLISVEVDDTDPKFAAELANAHVEELANFLANWQQQKLSSDVFFSKNNLHKLKIN
jgi:hypothetical protein